MSRARWRLTVAGVVQGVGFRPNVYALARQHGLTGFVGNDSGGVFIEVEGSPAALAAFKQDLVDKPPPLAHIESIDVVTMTVQDSAEFTIVHSTSQPTQNTLISPDISICDDCLRELFDPADRRYRYPFINCTNCGPRYTIIRDIPYDRPLTTMVDFPMCAACRAEYDNPLDRRFHAQPNACPVCGPQVTLECAGMRDVTADDAIETAQKMLLNGSTIAVKGLGGFHLACDATNDAALATLRERKGRVDKPFAVMVRDLEAARRVALLDDAEAALLTSKERPIVLLRKRGNSPLSDLVAPGNNAVGVMLPYTPLHHLLFASSSLAQSPPALLVMTSGNFSAEPIVHTNADARERLAPLADALLHHNRDIHTRCDDSVMRVTGTRQPTGDVAQPASNPVAIMPVRRSRGYAPFPVKLPIELPAILAVGGELKATFCLAKDSYATMSQHIGDMENWETLTAFEQAVDQMQHLFRVESEIIAHDLHPGYLSTRWASERAAQDVQPPALVPVQHHHAHIAAVMAENGHSGARPVIGFAFDGTGYGPDGTIWGGEVLLADYRSFERIGHLTLAPLPGGDAAIKRPYRIALAQLWAADLAWDERLPCVAAASAEERRILIKQLEAGVNVVQTSSFGRLFDAVAGLAGVRQAVTYEAQAAIELESLADRDAQGRYAFGLHDGPPLQLDPTPVLSAVVADVLAGVSAAVIATRFHHAVADAVLALAERIRAATGYQEVALSGGVWQNVTLLNETARLLESAEFTVLTHHLVPPNDGGLALGQAVIAGVQATSEARR